MARRRLFGDRVDVFPFPWLFSPLKWDFSIRPLVQVGRGAGSCQQRADSLPTVVLRAAKLLLP